MSAIFDHYENVNILAKLLQGQGCVVFWLQEPLAWFDTEGGFHNEPTAGYLSDGYSVPQCLWSLIRGLTSVIPGVKHDYDYQIGVPKMRADLDIYRGTISNGDSKYSAIKIFTGLFIGGHIAYNKYRCMRQEGVDIVALRTAHTVDEAVRKAKEKYV